MTLNRREFHGALLGLASVTARAQTATRGISLPVSRRQAALLIGNNRYTSVGALANAVNDARDMATTLGSCRFETTVETDLPLAGFRAVLDRFINTLSRGDVALFFYAGHGIQIDGENYIIPVDFNVAHGETGVSREAVRVSELQDRIAKSGARLNIFVVDACRNNPFRPSANTKGLALMDAGLGTCIALSAGPGQTASDNPGERNGLFTKNLLLELSGPPAPIEQVFKRVKDKVYDASHQAQRPWLLFDTIGDFVFTPAAQGAASSQQPPPPPPPKVLELETLLETGKTEFQNNRFPEAAAAFEAALRLDQNNPYTCNALGAARMRMRQTSVAVGLFSRAIELKPDYAAAYFNRGLLYYTTSDQLRAAVQDFSWAIDEEPFDPRPYDLRGKCYLNLSENDLALADFNRALELNPSDFTALLGRGKVRYRARNNAEAIRDLTESIAIHPTAETYAVRSQAYLAAGKRAESDADRREADRLQPR